MPDESCRTCGGELVRCALCAECRKDIQKICLACNQKTVEAIHTQCLHLDLSQKSKPRNPSIIVPNSSRSIQVLSSKKYQHNVLEIFGIMLIIVLGISGTVYFGITHSHISNQIRLPTIIQNNGQLVTGASENTLQDVSTYQLDNVVNPTYSNCLGVSNGMHLTITCPTEYGGVYKAVVSIPLTLSSQLETKVFNIRNLAITESFDHILIEYQQKTYLAGFVGW